MSELPWSKFFWSDWEADQGLRLCSLAAQGLWMRMLCVCAKGDPKGYLAINNQPLDSTGVARLCGITADEAATLMDELELKGVFSRDRRKWIYSRRMVRDVKKAAEGKKHATKRWSQSDEKPKKKPPPNGVANGLPTTQKPEARSQKETPTPYGVGEAVEDWNRVANDHGLPACQKLTAQRKRQIEARLKDAGEDGWKRALAAIRSSNFMLGENDRRWKATIDYVARESAFVRLLESAPTGGGSGQGGGRSDESWRIVMQRWQSTGSWPAEGDQPGTPGGRCLVPQSILEEFGIGPEGGQLRLVAAT